VNRPSSSSIPRWRVRLTGLVVAASLVAASCSGDDDTSSETSPAVTDAPTTTEAVTTTDAPATTQAAVTTVAPATTEPSTTGASAAEGEFWTGAAPYMSPVEESTAAEWQGLAEAALAASPGTPGAIIAVSDPELGFWSAAIGDAEFGVDPMTLDHHSRIGSITKTMTAVAVLQQVDQGTISLDDTVAEIVPDIAEEFPDTAELTVKDLLTMTSGLPDYANVVGGATAQAIQDPSKVWTPEEIIASALNANEVQPVGTPGYSTTNYTILGLMFEAVTGETIEDGVTRVAEEAGLTDTALLPGEQNDMPDPSTHGYIDDNAVGAIKGLTGEDVAAGTDTTDWSMSWGGAGGGAYSTISDLFLWASTASGNTLLSSDLGDQRLATDNFISDAGAYYGLGLLSESYAPGWVGHSGQALGWEALAMYNPETGGTFAVLVNSTSGLSGFYGVWTTIFGIETATAGDDATSGETPNVALIVGPDVILATITECTWDGSELTLTATADGVEIAAITGDDGTIDVTVSGDSELSSSGGSIEEDSGTLVITGTATATDGSTTDLTMNIDSTTCS